MAPPEPLLRPALAGMLHPVVGTGLARWACGALLLAALVGCGPVVGTEDSGGDGDGGGTDPQSTTDGEESGSQSSSTSDGLTPCIEQLEFGALGAFTPQVVANELFWSTGDGRVQVREFPQGDVEDVLLSGSSFVTFSVVNGGLLYAVEGEVSILSFLGEPAIPVAAEQNNPMWPVQLGNRVYWLNAGSGLLAGGLMRRDLDGLNEEVADGLGFPRSLVTDGTDVFVLVSDYFTEAGELSGVVLRYGDADGELDVIATTNAPQSLRFHGGRLYWLEQGGPGLSGPLSVRSIDTDGGTGQTHASLEAFGIGLAVDDTDVYFTTLDAGVARVHRVALGTGEREVVLEDGEGPIFDVALIPGTAYVTSIRNPDNAEPTDAFLTSVCRE